MKETIIKYAHELVLTAASALMLQRTTYLYTTGQQEQYMRVKKEAVLLLLIFVFSLTLRLAFVLQTTEFNSDEAYFTLRQVEHIKATGLPIKDDPLSYGGREQLALPGFYYLIAFFSYLMPAALALKIIPNIIAASLVLLSYLIAERLTKNKTAGLVAAFATTLIPIVTQETANQGSAHAFALLMICSVTYLFLRMRDNPEAWLPLYIIIFFIAALTDPLMIIAITGMFAYLILTYVFGQRPRRSEIEISLFSAFLLWWVLFLFFKKALLFYGPKFASAVLPRTIISEQISIILPVTQPGLALIPYLYAIGFLPVIFAVYSLHRGLRQEQGSTSNAFLLLLGMTISAIIAFSTGIVESHEALSLLSVFIAILCGPAYAYFSDYMAKTKASFLRKPLVEALLLIFLVTSGILSFNVLATNVLKAPDKSEIEAMHWLAAKHKTPVTVAIGVEEGNMIEYYAGQKTIADTRLVMAPQSEERLKELDLLWTTPYQVQALRILTKYNARYLFVSEETRAQYGSETPKFINKDTNAQYAQDPCFENVFSNDRVTIYRRVCDVA